MASVNIECYVKLPTGKVITFDLLPSDTIETLQERVAVDLKISKARVEIKFDGKVLSAQKTLQSLGVRQETILKAEVLSVKPINLIIKNCEEETRITVNNISTAKEVKDLIEEITGHCQKGNTLKFKSKKWIQPQSTARDIGLTDGSIVYTEKTVAVTESVKVNNNNDATPEELEEKRNEVVSTFSADGKAVEVVFCFDTTGSMYSCLQEVRRRLRETVEKLLADIRRIRIGIIAFGDYCDYNNYVLRSIDLTANAEAIVEFVDSVPSTGGGDAAECYEWTLRQAQKLSWSPEAAKALVLIGDSEPHEPSYTDQRVCWRHELDCLVAMDVKVYGVRALSRDHVAPFYRTLAERSGGAYVQFKHFPLIKDMFLAVCYQESSPEQLDAFVETVENEGRMTTDVKEMLTQIKNQEEKKAKPASSVVEDGPNEAWWNSTLDTNATPRYMYHSRTNTWAPYSQSGKLQQMRSDIGTNFRTCFTSNNSDVSTTEKPLRKKTKLKCSVM